ncbi:hypothetical protein [Rossellomorea sp. NS-SX7]|uniref:hypothetical protein n=1 Tax=Rossellomorea sp. NS-SX7 TaxID=3463856 RepID=UPI004057E20F
MIERYPFYTFSFPLRRTLLNKSPVPTVMIIKMKTLAMGARPLLSSKPSYIPE